MVVVVVGCFVITSLLIIPGFKTTGIVQDKTWDDGDSRRGGGGHRGFQCMVVGIDHREIIMVPVQVTLKNC